MRNGSPTNEADPVHANSSLLARVAELEEELARLKSSGAGSRPAGEAPGDSDGAAQSKAQQEAILGQLAEGVIVTDRDGRITFVNEAAKRLHGTARLDVGPDDYTAAYQLLTEDRRPYPSRELPLARAVLNKEIVEDARWRIRRMDGSEVLAIGSARPIIGDSGEPIGAVLTLRDDTERSRTEAALRASEEFSRRVLASSPDCIKVLSLDGRLEFMTEGGMCVMEADDFDHIQDLCWSEFWQQEERAKALAAVDEARIGGTARFQGFAETFKGSPRWWDVTVSPINGADGRPEKLLAVSRDITPIKESEEVLRISEERLRHTSRRLDAILSNTQMAVFLMDERQHCVFANPAAEALTGYSFEEMQSRPLHDVIHHKKPDGSHYPLEECPIDRAFPERAHTHGEELFVARDGSFYPVGFTASPVLDDMGNPIGTVIEARNISEEKARDAALRELNQTLERRVEQAIAERDRTWNNARDLLAVVDTEGVFRAVNPAWSAILGWQPDEIVGQDFRGLIHPDDALPSEGALATASRGELRSYENRYLHKDGSYRCISWVGAPEGGLIYASGRDVTDEKAREEELKGAQEALRQSQKMEAVGQLTGGIAHDFNNLLTIVTGNIDMASRALEAAGSPDPRAARALVNAMKGAERAAALTQRLLAFSRRQPLAPKPLDVDKLVLGMSDLLHRSLGETVKLEIVTNPGLWMVEADPNQLESCLLNLAVNARDAMPQGGDLAIETANARLDDSYVANHAEVAPGQYVVIAVTDTGQGMSKDTAARVFEPFFTTKDVGKGTGLGLSMVYGFVKQSGGHVKIYSEEGHGTTVKIYLPRLMSEEAAEEEQATLTQGLEVSRHRETILVVEDDDDVRAYTVECLRELGYRVIEAHDGTSALRLMERQEEPLDLLFSDVVMPGMSGRELAEAARERQPGLKVLYTSGYTRNAIVHGGRLDAGVDLIAKPFTYQALARKVRDVLDRGKTGRVLLVEAEATVRALACEALSTAGYTVEEAANAGETLAKVRSAQGQYDAVVLDFSAPIKTAQALLAELRALHSDLPILITDAGSAQEMRAQFSSDHCIAVIEKPYTSMTLQKALEELGVCCAGSRKR